MAGGEDWLLRPVLRGMCKYESLIDGTLGILDIAIMNEAISVEEENKERIQRALEHG